MGKQSRRKKSSHGDGKKTNSGQASRPNARGDCEDLGSHVFTLHDDRRSETYELTKQKILDYVQANYTWGQDLVWAIEKEKEFNFDDPSVAPNLSQQEANLSYGQKLKLQVEVKNWMYHQEKYRENKANLYGLIWGQCDVALQDTIQSRPDYKSKLQATKCPRLLLNAAQDGSCSYQAHENPISAILSSLSLFLDLKQGETESLSSYYRWSIDIFKRLEELLGRFALTNYLKTTKSYQQSKAKGQQKMIHDSHD